MTEAKSEIAVFVQNGYKSYTKNKTVLNNLNLSVDKGTIYSLLGSSGCGKTTLLNCIVGVKHLDSGNVWVLGGSPGSKESGIPGSRVGYMPQEYGLVEEFTVIDAVYFFARLNLMEDDLIEKRFAELSILLELPQKNRLVSECSGGQRRRISLGCALIHQPELLILDEPTVGLDPILCDRIWKYLIRYTWENNSSVIITTHYVEEARQSNKIGFMRHGQILKEDSCENLFHLFNTTSLETIYLQLCQRDSGINSGTYVADSGSSNTLELNPVNTQYNRNNSMQSNKIVLHDTKNNKKTSAIEFNKHRFLALLSKNCKQFYRNISGVVFTFLFPFAVVTFFYECIGRDITNVRLAVVNEENFNNCSGVYINQTITGHTYTNCYFKNLDCRFIQYLDHPMFDLNFVSTLEEGLERVKHGKSVGVLYMAKNYTGAFENRYNLAEDVEDVDIEAGQIQVFMDMSNRELGVVAKYKLYDLYKNFQEKLNDDCNRLQGTGRSPVNIIDPGIYGKKDDLAVANMIPCLMIGISFFIGSTLTSQIILSDRFEGIWERSMVSRVSSLEITLSHLLLQGCITLGQDLIIVITAVYVFKLKCEGSVGLLAMLIFFQGTAGMVFGFLVSVISVNHSMAFHAITGTFFPLNLLSGMIWPFEAMPIVLQWLATFLPFGLPAFAAKNIMKKGWGIENWQVARGFVLTSVWITSLIIISIIGLRARK